MPCYGNFFSTDCLHYYYIALTYIQISILSKIHNVQPFDYNSFLVALLALKTKPTLQFNNTRVTINWSEPDKTESLNESITYDIGCFLCKKNICNLTCGDVMIKPGRENIGATSVVIMKLQPDKSYQFRVYPKNSLNKKISENQWKYMETEQFTYQSPSKNFFK